MQAQAKAVSATLKIMPPWQIPWPLTMSSRTVIRVRAQPSPCPTSSMPSIRDAASPAIIASTGPGWPDWPASCDKDAPHADFP